LSVLWSIGVEDQFYLVWPLFFAFLPFRLYKFLFPVVLLVSIVFRYFNPAYSMLEFHTLSCIGDMAIGGLGGYLIYYSRRFKLWAENMPRAAIAGIYLGAVLIFFFRHQLLSHPLVLPFERAIIGVFFLGVLLEQSYARNSFFKLGRLKWAGHLGRISYGLYCLHFIGILIVTTLTARFGYNDQLWQVIVLETLLALAVTIVISQASYSFYEKPFLKLKNKFSVIKKSKSGYIFGPGITR
ncbi:MAG: acyltransferase, partial [Cyclobacteriaceae bacterium]